MKKILILTDFSANAEHAAENAAYICVKLNADILLYHTSQVIPITPYDGGGPYAGELTSIYTEEGKEKMTKHSAKLKEFVKRLNPESRLSIHHLQGDGGLGPNIKDLLKHNDIELIIMGARSGSYLDHFLAGSETQSVLRNTDRPLLIVPPAVNLEKIKNVVFATDYNAKDKAALNYLIDLAKLLTFRIQVVHINVFGEDANKDIIAEMDFKKFANELKFQDITYHAIRGKDVVPRLNRYCEECGADILAVVHYHQGFFSRLFNASQTTKELANQRQSLLIFPPKFTAE
ncbi:universal stress protein [Mucilaginibacter aquariorum]|uniref:Universal stress protein n=1 Tax=Mucilaginibacter aquariorum TaxID=2967225 RepID=A0ABT1T3F4_9SPHI|nr:universal stress protein [Mucilaginibacter aquariorum]MCQ6959139.1 universal stress protein [Mucilaginibacter aquariorum]